VVGDGLVAAAGAAADLALAAARAGEGRRALAREDRAAGGAAALRGTHDSQERTGRI